MTTTLAEFRQDHDDNHKALKRMDCPWCELDSLERDHADLIGVVRDIGNAGYKIHTDTDVALRHHGVMP